MRRMLPQLALRRLRVLLDLLHLLARLQPILQRIRLAQHPRLRSLLLHLRRKLRLPLHVPACRCGLLQRREALLPEHVPRQQRLGLRVLLAHLQHCNAIQRVRQRQARRPGKLVRLLRKACARLVALRNNIVRAVRRRVDPAVRPGNVRVDRLRVSRNDLAAAAGPVAATIKDQ